MRICCDSIFVPASLSATGKPLFAKNSDRPEGESQPLVQVPAADHRAGEPIRCQYIEIEQVAHTHAFIGSRPHWLWGLEHGVNEHRVAIGNHTIYTKDPLAETGLLGMDLVRLGLERAATAAEAVEVITGLIERYGQGGSGFLDTVWPYHNSFLIADPTSAYLLEASARHWAVRDISEGGSASNHVTIGTDWMRLSDGCADHARAMGWWDGNGRLDFASAYRDTSVVPPVVSSGRYAATCRALANGQPLDVAALERLMRDHYDSGETYRPGAEPDDERFFSVCMHAGGVGTTAASMIVELDPEAPLLVRAAQSSPCTAPYLPLFADAPIPAALAIGGREPSPESAWWRLDGLRSLVAADWEHHGPV
ncbi:MAG: secernin-3, partial [Deltaproteobacteria bacterium]